MSWLRKTALIVWLLLLSAVALSVFFGCGDDDPSTGSGQADDDNDDVDDDDDDNNDDDDDDDDGPDWLTIDDGDPAGDCAAADADCAADIAQLSYALFAGKLYLDLQFHDGFDDGAGSLEIFLIPADTQIVGHTIRFNAHKFSFWYADCSSAAKHSGCHWTSAEMPDSFAYEWSDAGFTGEIDLADLAFGDLTELLMGVAVAPFFIEATADFTDRYPDALLVTSDAIQGLVEVPFVEQD